MRLPLPLVDIIKLSEEELPLLTGSSSLEEGSRILEETGIRLAAADASIPGHLPRCATGRDGSLGHS